MRPALEVVVPPFTERTARGADGFAHLTCSTGHAGVSANSKLTLEADHLIIRSVSRRAPLLAQLVIVSNRVAIPDGNAKARAGGLEVAVKAALKQKSGIWFGWSGKVATRTKIDTQRVVHDGITYITLDLSKEDHHEYYNGFTNRVLWPILHYREPSSRAGI